ncbi:hypothetical protein [Vineibacter terrae]|uniref:hypothetical protein n=1 Tax=Vineibacter terrae TaxID=2586908 RepID=UPI002E2F27E8|nr:hypothetical protein [Vineibacter terrae]HEX2890811.1 hypothetical protein [Vineibacter terrae]
MAVLKDGASTRGAEGTRPLIASVSRSLLQGDTSAPHLAWVLGLPLLGGIWLLLSPPRLLSREMTVDLLFNLTGAWRLVQGHVPHVDYHDPVGVLSFLLTRLGFAIVGPHPQAFLVGETIFLAFIFVAAVMAAARRLPPIPAGMFVLYVALLVLLPANIGDQPNAYTFAMSYNRWCWSAITVLCLIVFLPPRPSRRAAWLDAVVAGLLLLAMFYLKITFAAAGLGALALALLASDHVRARPLLWGGVLALVLANAAAPYNHAYLADIWEAAHAGYVRGSLPDHIRVFLASKAEYALYGSGVLLLFWLWQRGRAPFQRVIAAASILGMGMLVLTQNAQGAGVPVAMVIAFLVYEVLAADRLAIVPAAVATPLLAILVFPLLSIVSAATSLVGYHLVARHDVALLTVESTNLRGLAVPADVDLTTMVLNGGAVPYHVRDRVGESRASGDVSQSEYVQGLVDAAALFADHQRAAAKVLVMDQVNALPFMLGYPPPRGGNLWIWPGAPARSAENVFEDVDVVLIPKRPSFAAATLKAVTQYAPYLADNFPVREETPRWTILSRRVGAAAVLPGRGPE